MVTELKNIWNIVEPPGARLIIYNGAGDTYPNLMDAYPPFQINSNFGGAAVVIEMLMQWEYSIELLPALPDPWKSGSISGIYACGGFEVSLTWKDGKLMNVDILSKTGNNSKLKYQDKTIKFKTKKRESI